MVADIFCPIFTLKVTVLACLIQKKKLPFPPSGHQPGPLVDLHLPQYPQLQKKLCAHIFSGLSPVIRPVSNV